MNWKQKSLAVLCFIAMALGFYANGGVYVTPHNILVLLAFLAPFTALGLYCCVGLGMPMALFFRFVPLPFAERAMAMESTAGRGWRGPSRTGP